MIGELAVYLILLVFGILTVSPYQINDPVVTKITPEVSQCLQEKGMVVIMMMDEMLDQWCFPPEPAPEPEKVNQ